MSEVISIRAGANCSFCKDTGWIHAVKKFTHYHYGFRCGVCGSADRHGLSRNIQTWTSIIKKQFETLTEYFERQEAKRNEPKKPEIKNE